MKQAKEPFETLNESQLILTNGGGFAYDVGRVLRFLGISAGTAVGTAMACADWYMNDVVNDSYQNG
jgi:hypothetical protein